MRKIDVMEHFGTQQRVADALTAAGFRISQRGVSGWGELVPLDRAVQIERITNRKLKVDLSKYRNGEDGACAA